MSEPHCNETGQEIEFTTTHTTKFLKEDENREQRNRPPENESKLNTVE